MSDVSLTLDEPFGRFVEDLVRSGAYPDAAAVVRAGLARLRADVETEAAKETRYRTLLRDGIDELDRDEGVEVENVGGWLRALRRDAEA